jgi:hypothetical protein
VFRFVCQQLAGELERVGPFASILHQEDTTMSDFYSGTDLFSEFGRLQREMASLFGGFPSSIRSGRSGAFPQINIGATDDSNEIVVFAPGVNAAELNVSIDKGGCLRLPASASRRGRMPVVTPAMTKPATTSAPMRRSASPARSAA